MGWGGLGAPGDSGQWDGTSRFPLFFASLERDEQSRSWGCIHGASTLAVPQEVPALSPGSQLRPHPSSLP